ncbi:MAG: branched-chain amino acid ABC transporter permease [Acidobacteriia bacterium]|nr:branched-chain amino acid ABC transporter permease [Terriglobia bacterium]
MKRNLYPLIFLLALIVLPLLLRQEYYQHLIILFMMWVIIGSAWNLLAGYTGRVSFGHAAFFGSGAYAAGLLTYHYAISPWWGMVTGGLLATAVAFPFGWITFRLRGAYFALATLALNEVLKDAAKIAEPVTNGMVGILIMPTFSSKLPYYYIILFMMVLTVLCMRFTVHSKLGYCFVSIREDQDAAESMGINTTRYKMISLCIGTFWTGLAGAFYMNYMGFIDPSVVFSLQDLSIAAVLVGIVGGVGTIYGPAVGAFVMIAVQEFFRSGFFGLFKYFADRTGSSAFTTLSEFVKSAHTLGFGLLVILVILLLPNGIVGDWAKIKRSVLRIKPEN